MAPAASADADGILNADEVVAKRFWAATTHTVKTAAEWDTQGVVSTDLQARLGDVEQNGNFFGLVSAYTRSDGSQAEIVDVWFAVDPSAQTMPPVPVVI